MSELPKGWAKTSLGEIAVWGSGGTPSRSEPSFYGGSIPWIKSGELNARYVKSTEESITEAAVSGSSAKIFPAGSVAIAMYGATIGKTAILGVDAATNQACAVGIPVEGLTDTDFLYRLLQNEKDAFIAKGKGGAQPNISQALIKAHEVSLPPLAEQTRIAAKLDELLAQVDTLKARIDGIPALLKRFRQSVLAAAVSGRLTEAWRGGAEVDWSFQRAADVCEKVQSGGTPKEGFSESGVPFLKVYNIVNQEIDFGYRPQYISEAVHRGASSKSITLPGDVVMNIVGPPLGKIATIPAASPEWNINQAITLFRPSKDIVSGWISIVLLGGENLRSIINETKGSAGQVNISLSQCRDFLFPVPSIEEQTEIVRRVEQLFAFADQLEAKVSEAKTRIDRLTQSILAKAFRGELVPQDPNDEPACVLLERIQAQRASAPKAKRGRKSA